MTEITDPKAAVRQFWDAASCGEASYALGPTEAVRLQAQADARYQLEPYLKDFAGFADARDLDVLEVGVGMGADHLEFARASPRTLTGVDLTPRAVQFTSSRLAYAGLGSALRVADAEHLPFESNRFDLVYSWGVLHHSPDPEQAFREVCRVLKPEGRAKIMIYHTWSLTGLMLWTRYALLRGRPFLSLAQIYGEHLESPGTKAYTKLEAERLVRRAGFKCVTIRVQLNHGDLLEGEVGQRHRGALLSAARRLWPRALLRRYGQQLGLYLLIEARK